MLLLYRLGLEHLLDFEEALLLYREDFSCHGEGLEQSKYSQPNVVTKFALPFTQGKFRNRSNLHIMSCPRTLIGHPYIFLDSRQQSAGMTVRDNKDRRGFLTPHGGLGKKNNRRPTLDVTPKISPEGNIADCHPQNQQLGIHPRHKRAGTGSDSLVSPYSNVSRINSFEDRSVR
jgi:hypothetical protein